MEDIVEVVKLVVQEHVQRIDEQILEVPVPPIVEDIVERVQKCTSGTYL